MANAVAIKRLTSEFMKLVDDPVPGIVARPVDEAAMGGRWSFALVGPPDSAYEGGVFTGFLDFPADYPHSPPKMRFDPPITHPNVYATGDRRGEVCISILHAGADRYGYERLEERWSPVHGVRSILLSVTTMLADVNIESPANIDAAKLYSRDRPAFQAVVRAEVERSLGLGGAGGGGGGARAAAGGASSGTLVH